MSLSALLLLLSLVACFPCPATAAVQTSENEAFLWLVKQGEPQAQIVVERAASPTERYAAEELQRAVERVSGATLPITERISPDMPFRVIIGTPQSSAAVAAADLFDTSHPEEICIAQQGSTLYLAGPTPRAALYATYTLLQEVIGVRWFWPGQSGEYSPRQESIAIPASDIRHVPSIEVRSIAINSPFYDEDTLIWMARNRMNVHYMKWHDLETKAWQVDAMKLRGFQVTLSGHNAVLSQSILDQHPEYMALYGGKRQKPAGHPPHLCWSNPAVQEAMAQTIAGWWESNPHIDTVSFYGADHNYFCECDECQAFAPDVSTRWQRFSKIVIDRVNELHPGGTHSTLGYQAYRNVPTEAAPFDLVGYATYNINYTKPMTDPSNAAAREEILSWQALGVPMGIRGYHFCIFNEKLFVPQTSVIVDEIAWAHQNGLKGWTSETAPYRSPASHPPQDDNWVTNRMALYAAAQAMWDARTRPEDVMCDWATYVFGPADEPMRLYYEAMDRAWRSTTQPISYVHNPASGFSGSFLSRELLQTADACLQEARRALVTVTDEITHKRIQEQINLEAAMLSKWHQTYLTQQGRTAHYEAHIPRAAARPRLNATIDDPAWKNAARLPAFEDSQGAEALDRTHVLALWDEEALYLRFISYAQTEQLKMDSLLDDAIELFLEDPSEPAAYFHLAINANGARYEARADATLTIDEAWSAEWLAQTRIGKTSWIADVALPLASFGIKPTPSATGIWRFPPYSAMIKPTTWRMSFKRSGTGRPNTGWPDAAFHNPATFADVRLVETVPQQKRLLLYDASGKGDPQRANTLYAELVKAGFSTTHILQGEAELSSALAKGADVIVLRHLSNARLSDEFVANKLRPFVEEGGLLLIAATGALPLDKWFGEEAGVQWSGWDYHPNRVTAWYEHGDWLRKPHALEAVIQKKTTPGTGYKPLSDAWTVMARMRMADDRLFPYLMQIRIGQGTLVLTSSNFGYAGGHEMFGHLNPSNAAMLVDNLLTAHREQ
ncbi:MAG: DUF4838 domain-containing protein [Limnochordia bacterium]|jgi:hypothetical protein